jgi:hypothetical protein
MMEASYYGYMHLIRPATWNGRHIRSTPSYRYSWDSLFPMLFYPVYAKNLAKEATIGANGLRLVYTVPRKILHRAKKE